MVRGGWYHFLVLDSSGSVTCWIGDPQASKQTLETYTSCISDGTSSWCVEECIPIQAPAGHPLRVPSSFEGKVVKDIACGAYHNVVRFTDDSIACWGLNSMGQCNTPATLANGSHAKRKKIVGLHAGYSTTAVSFNDGTVLAWGDPAVCDIVNSWTDLMMSPVNNLASGSRPNYDNVDTSSPQYAKPRFSAAYNTTANLVTWNVHSDHTFSWHSEAANEHCMPFFDLGCEADPFIPLEYNPDSGDAGDDVRLPGYLTEFPRWLLDSPVGGSCDSDCISSPSSNAWKDAIAAKWRNRIFQATSGATEGSVTRSCCDLEVKTDFAVGMRRTGQLITTRSNNRESSCPSGYVDGRSQCRDCSVDALQTVTNDSMVGGGENCPPNAGDLCSGYPNCNCCSSGSPSTFLGCPDCHSRTCQSDQRFQFPVAGSSTSSCVSSVPRFHEGIGCMGANPHLEGIAFDPNWAVASAGSMSGRWSAGEQVRDSAHTGGPKPVSNVGTIAQNWGWTSMPQPDVVTTPQQPQEDCKVSHGTSTTCDKLCKDTTDYEGGQVDPSGESIWRYPMQMFAQGIVAGVDTTCWTLPPIRLAQEVWTAPCAECGQANACNNLQDDMPNGGELSYGTIFSGTQVSAGTVNIDKYGYANFYRGGVGFTASPCNSANHLLYFEGHMAPSKPWGPYQIAIFNSVGGDKNDGYHLTNSPCHCCSGTLQIGPPNVAKIMYPTLAAYGLGGVGGGYGLDQVLGTYFGMPNEANMHCRNPSTHSECSCNCESIDYTGSENCGFGAIFCAYHGPRSVASTRMAFAMIRADHRALDGGGNRLEPFGDCGEYSTVDPAEYLPCASDGEGGFVASGVRTEMALHIWGSLYDPCPPWPRLCKCSETPEVAEGCNWDDLEAPYQTPCDGSHPEGSAAPEAAANASEPGQANWVWGACARYPKWTPVPASNTNRSSSSGYWSGSSWVLNSSPASCETAGPNTRYCPDCDSYEQTWYRATEDQ
jgi:hypothetical protein